MSIQTFDRLDLAVAEQASARSSDTALVDGSGSLTFAQLEAAIESVSRWLSIEARFDEPVGLFLDNSIEAVVGLLGALRAGRVIVPINTKSDATILNHIVANAGLSSIIVGSKDLPDGVEAHLLHLDRTAWPDSPVRSKLNSVNKAGNDPAVIFYTSGSTGKPKGVIASHRNIVLGAASVAEYLAVTRGMRVGAVLPISFDAGLSWVLTGLASGAEVHLLRYIFPRSLVDDLIKHRIEALLAVPTVFFALSTVNLPAGSEGKSPVRLMASTGGRMDPAVVRDLKVRHSKLRFVVMYGLTEAFRATYLPDCMWYDHPTSIGGPIPHAAVHILRNDGTEAEVDEVGEIVQSGPLVTLGYLNAPEAQAKRFGPCPVMSPFVQTHPLAVYSGDFGYRGSNGLLYWVGRKDRLIKSRGFRIAPEEIEKAIEGHSDHARAVVWGRDDLQVGQRIVAVVEANSAPELVALRDAIRPYVAGYMLPNEVHALSTLPLSPNGKVDVEAVRRLIEK